MALDIEKYNELRFKCKSLEVFTYDDLLINGTPAQLITNYLKMNPSKKFRTWLIDEGLVIKL